MQKKILYVFGIMILITIVGIVSCTKCGDSTVYKVVDLYMEQTGVQFNGNNQTPDRLYYYDIYKDSVYYSFYGIYIEPDLQIAAVRNLHSPSFGLVNTAYACDPIPATTNDRITDIEIIADQDYDDSHPKGSNLAEYFDVVVTYHHTNTYEIKHDLVDYLGRKPIVPDRLVLILKVKPKQNTRLRFTLNYKQNGVSMDSKSKNFKSITLTQ